MNKWDQIGHRVNTVGAFVSSKHILTSLRIRCVTTMRATNLLTYLPTSTWKDKVDLVLNNC